MGGTQTPTPPLYTLGPAGDKGLGLFAAAAIPIGTLIIAESPLFTASDPAGVEAAARRLSPTDKAKLYALTDVHATSPDQVTAYGPFRTNALPLGAGSPTGGLFPICSRINHSCAPNVYHYWDDASGQERIYAYRAVAAGEELTATYVPLYAPRDARRAQLKAAFKFTCMCTACDRSGDELATSDSRRARIDKINDDVPRITSRDSQAGFRLIKERIRLIEAEGLSDTAELACCHYEAFQASIGSADWKTASTHAGLAFAYRALCEGASSPEAQRMMGFCLEPQTHMAALMSMFSPKLCKPKICDGCGAEEGRVAGKGKKKAGQGVKMLLCGGCGLAVYCGNACQTAHWRWHKDVCKSCKLIKKP